MGTHGSKSNRMEDTEESLGSYRESNYTGLHEYSSGEVNAELDVESTLTRKCCKENHDPVSNPDNTHGIQSQIQDDEGDDEVSNGDFFNDQKPDQQCNNSGNHINMSCKVPSDVTMILPVNLYPDWDIIEHDSGEAHSPVLSDPDIPSKNLPTDDMQSDSGKRSLSMDEFDLSKTTPAVSVDTFISEASSAPIESPGTEPNGTGSLMRIQIFMKYNERRWLLTTGVKQVECNLIKKYKKRKVFWQVHITLLPQRKKRYRTKYKRTSTPIFNQVFDICDIPKECLSQVFIRYRLYRCFERMGRKKCVGEVEVRDLNRLLYKQDNLIDGEWHVFKVPHRGEISRKF